MSDASDRERIRRAKADGDHVAESAAAASAVRSIGGRHGDKIGALVIVETGQCHWGGRLLGCTELGGGAGIAHLHPCWWLSNTETVTGLDASASPRRVLSSEIQPADVYLTAAVVVTLMEPSWEKSLP